MAAMEQQSHKTALLLNHEIAAVVTAMRQRSKWALIPTRYTRLQDDEVGDDPLLDELKVLRRRIFHWHDWSQVVPMEYINPFLDVILSPETSGPVTGVALTSVLRMLEHYTLGESATGQLEVMQVVADATARCRFESTDVVSDHITLFKILQVLLACVKCPGGSLLTNDNVINIFQACFRIGHNDAHKVPNELLTQSSRQILLEMTWLLFARIGELPQSAMSPNTAHSLAHSPRLHVSHDAGAAGAVNLATENGSKFAAADSLADSSAAADGESATDTRLTATEAEATSAAGGQPASSANTTLVSLGTQALPHTPQEHKALPEGGLKVNVQDPARASHGLECVVEVLGFIVTLITTKDDESHPGLSVFGLELMHAALQAGGAGFERHEAAMAQLREDVWPALCAIAHSSPDMRALAGATQVALSLYVHLGRHLLLQLEAFVSLLLARLGDARGGAHATELQEVALEGLLDLCNQPGFVRDVYVNLDCRIERSNLFEGVCATLSKSAFPVHRPLASAHILALDGLISIMSALAKGCLRPAVAWDDEEATPTGGECRAIWEARCRGQPPPLSEHRRPRGLSSSPGEADSPHAKAQAAAQEANTQLTQAALLEKSVKSRLALATDHFNRSPSKGFDYLQSMGLLLDQEDPQAVGRILRYSPGLSKVTIGELLGENDDFHLAVLDHFTQTFQFESLSFDTAIRMYLESFRLPGEAQKINRIMETFGAHYHRQCPNIFRNADAVYILAYSVIILNTDQHNDQVKKKMTCEEFIRNNRGINAGENLPQDFLAAVYDSISRNEIRITSDSGGQPSPVLWADLGQQSRGARGRMLELGPVGTPGVDREMFALMWSPTVAAVSVVLDHAEDPAYVRMALDGLLTAARLASHHRLDQVMDSLVVSLCKWTSLLDPSAPKPAVAFGEMPKARMAMEVVFKVANRYGDSLSAGWRNIMECVVRLYQLGLLPPAVLVMEAEDPVAAAARLPRPSAARRSSTASLISRAFSSLISIESSDSGIASGEAGQRELAATQRTIECVEACALDELFADSKFLRAESLVELVKAVMWASGPVMRIAASGEHSDTAEMCLELVLAIALRNRDRILLMWSLVHDYLALVMAPEGARTANPLVARAALGLLRVCQRLLPYKADCAPPLLRSLQLLLRLNASVAWDLATRLAAEAMTLVRSCASHILMTRGWRTVCALIMLTDMHPEASPVALQALALAAAPDVLTAPAFLPVLEAAAIVVDRHKDDKVDGALQALDIVELLFAFICRTAAATPPADQQPELHQHRGTAEAQGRVEDGKAADAVSVATSSLMPDLPKLAAHPALGAFDHGPGSPSDTNPELSTSDMWVALVQVLCKYGAEQSDVVCNHTLVILQRVLGASEGPRLSGGLWIQVLGDLILPLVAQLSQRLSHASRREAASAARSLRMGVALLSKSLLQHLASMAPQPAFAELWSRALSAFQEAVKSKREELTEFVPEALKNMLLVMAAQEVLTPEWKDAQERSMWDTTWHKAHTISSGLTPALLTASGLYHPPTPPPEPEPEPEPASSPSVPPAAEAGAGMAEAPTPAPGTAAVNQIEAGDAAAMAAAVLVDEHSVEGQGADPLPQAEEAAGEAVPDETSGAASEQEPLLGAAVAPAATAGELASADAVHLDMAAGSPPHEQPASNGDLAADQQATATDGNLFEQGQGKELSAAQTSRSASGLATAIQADADGEYGVQQQAQQAGSACKQS